MTRSTSFIQDNKEIKKQTRHPNEKKGTTLFIDDIIICVENVQNV